MGEEILSGGHFWRNHTSFPDPLVHELVITDIGRGHRRCGSYF